MRVLSVTADINYAKVLNTQLNKHGYDFENVPTGGSALRKLPGANFVLLDLDIADRDGLSVCRDVRMETGVPIICYTARTDELDRVLALQAGSDDCLVAPFGMRELVTRMETIARRRYGLTSRRQGVVVRGPLEINPGSREVCVSGRRIELTRKEFDLLLLLATQPEKVISRAEILGKVWTRELSHPGRTIDTHVSSVRGKLGAKEWIVTVRGVGFQFGRVEIGSGGS